MIKSLNQTTSYAHWHAFLYLHAHIKTFICLSQLKSEKKTELNEHSELEYSKTPSQISSYAHWHAFLYFLTSTFIKMFIHSSHVKSEKKKTELNELSKLECSKTPSQMSSYAHKHVSLYLHAKTNINILLYWSYTKSQKNWKKFNMNFS